MVCRIVAAIDFMLLLLPASPSVMPVMLCDAPIVGIDVAVVIVLNVCNDRDGWYCCVCIAVLTLVLNGVERHGTVHRVENAATAVASEHCEGMNIRECSIESPFYVIIEDTQWNRQFY